MKDNRKKYSQEITEHPDWPTIYQRWRNLRKKHPVCPEWKNAEAFARWALENGFVPSDKLLILDKGKPLGPDNCRWEPTKQNSSWRNEEWEAAYRWNKTVNRFRRRLGLEPFPEEKEV